EDFQVKVGGFRIELGEIEAALAGCEGVRAAVVAAPGARHHRRLVGYVVAEGPLDEGELLERVRAHAERRLPGYMVPPVLTVIDEMPLSANGKVDRTALPDPTTSQQEATRAATDLEEKILRVVSAHTPAGGVGVLDNFFDLGLDSLVLTRIHRRLRDELGLTFPITALFGEPNVRRLAGHLTGATTSSGTTRAARDRASLRRAALARRAK
ncbi:phosphopantetheine-binding protein, partial [Streptomyces sp. NPDC006274]